VAALLVAVAWGANHFVPLLPVYRATLGLSATALAQLFGVYALGLLPGLLLGGPLSDRIGRKRVVVPAAVIAVLGTAILGVGQTTFQRLLIGRFVVGLGSGATFSAATAWIADLAAAYLLAPGTGARRAAQALSAGFGGGPLVTALVAQWLPLPLQLPYAVQAAAALVGIAWIATMKVAPPVARTAAASSGTAPLVPAGFVGQVVPVAPWVFGLASISFAVLPGIVRPRLGEYAVLFTGVVTAATLFSGLLVQGPLRARGAATAGSIGLVVGVAGLALGALAAWCVSPLLVVLAAPVLGAGYGACLVAGLRFVETQSLPAQRGRVIGIFYVLAYLGFAAPLALAAVARRWGEVAALSLTSLLALLSLLLRRRARAT
jgi:hypothetical protein